MGLPHIVGLYPGDWNKDQIEKMHQFPEKPNNRQGN